LRHHQIPTRGTPKTANALPGHIEEGRAEARAYIQSEVRAGRGASGGERFAATRACIMAATQHLTERSLSNGYGITRSKTIT